MRKKSIWIVGLTASAIIFMLFNSFIWSSAKDKARDPKYLESYTGVEAQRTGSSECVVCHDTRLPESKRSHIFLLDDDEKNPNYGYGCEACHGAGGNHNGDPAGILLPSKMQAKNIIELCTKCHSSLRRFELKNWYLSEHKSSELDCLACHQGHSESKYFLAKDNRVALCLDCHQRKRSEFKMRSHHPVLENQLVCSSCHNPHSGKYDSQLNNELDNLCFGCHGDKEGPFAFDHDVTTAGGGDGCLTCHFVHGSNSDSLLRYPRRLCLQCHSELTEENHFSGSCWRSGCHSDIHGSYSNPLFFVYDE